MKDLDDKGKRKLKGYHWYMLGFAFLSAFIVVLALIIVQLGEATLSISIALGGAISGLIGLFVVVLQELQLKHRGARVYFHIWNPQNPQKYLGRTPGKKSYPLILTNHGSLPGKDIQCFLSITANKGSYKITDGATWKDVTHIQGNEIKEPSGTAEPKILSKSIPLTVYPKGIAGELYLGFIEIEPDHEGRYDIEITGDVHEASGVTERICKLSSDKENDESLCNQMGNFTPYF